MVIIGVWWIRKRCQTILKSIKDFLKGSRRWPSSRGRSRKESMKALRTSMDD
jgi:hypothetical protein